ncbi:uncharacterized protein LOC114573990 isoform X2 [Perca flavescens]|uniref:uncharacterized protein LOC114573990 isoform X2 n=1 Tax=Perca flavescens TaxID=8167 RepID=UPI00106EB149|nr:uncharacterized protein LOC114573990 isoform X2 [Perca flavescens]
MLFLVTENVQLICPKSLDAAVGDNVTLDFHLKPQWNETKWKGFVFECKQSSNIALVYKSGGFSDVDQAKRFRGRVSSDSSWDLSKGKLGWKISKFGQSDAGTYKCIVRPGKLNCCTELKIKQDHPHELNPSDGYQRHNTSSSIPEKPTDGNRTGSTNTLSGGAIAGIATAVIAVIALAIIARVIRLPCRQRFEGVRQNDPDAQAVDGRAGVQDGAWIRT